MQRLSLAMPSYLESVIKPKEANTYNHDKDAPNRCQYFYTAPFLIVPLNKVSNKVIHTAQ